MRKRVIVETPEGRLPVYIVQSSPYPRAGIVLLHDAEGIDDSTRRLCRQHAAAGFLVLCPDLYWRDPKASAVHSLDIEQAVNDAASVMAHARESFPACSRIGLLGVGQGGLIAFRTACCAMPDAAVACWPDGIEPFLDELRTLRCQVLIQREPASGVATSPQEDVLVAAAARYPGVTIDRASPRLGHGARQAQRRARNFLLQQLGVATLPSYGV